MSVDRGTTVVDLWNAATNELVWRGRADKMLSRNPDANLAKIDEASPRCSGASLRGPEPLLPLAGRKILERPRHTPLILSVSRSGLPLSVSVTTPRQTRRFSSACQTSITKVPSSKVDAVVLEVAMPKLPLRPHRPQPPTPM